MILLIGGAAVVVEARGPELLLCGFSVRWGNESHLFNMQRFASALSQQLSRTRLPTRRVWEAALRACMADPYVSRTCRRLVRWR